jgi:hypothetical protein
MTTEVRGRCTSAPVELDKAIGMNPKLAAHRHQHGRSLRFAHATGNRTAVRCLAMHR